MHDILVVEPDKVLGDTYKRALQGAGFSVDVQPDAQNAISSIDTNKPRLIILELELVKHNGVEFLYELRSYPDLENLPVIILSAISPQESGVSDTVQARLGIVEYLYKPQTTLKHLIAVATEAL